MRSVLPLLSELTLARLLITFSPGKDDDEGDRIGNFQDCLIPINRVLESWNYFPKYEINIYSSSAKKILESSCAIRLLEKKKLCNLSFWKKHCRATMAAENSSNSAFWGFLLRFCSLGPWLILSDTLYVLNVALFGRPRYFSVKLKILNTFIQEVSSCGPCEPFLKQLSSASPSVGLPVTWSHPSTSQTQSRKLKSN